MSTKLIIALGADHAGFEYKEKIMQFLLEQGYQVMDNGTHSTDSVDYPDYVHPTAQAVSEGIANFGILVCGTGNGVCITANKYPNIRAGLAWDVPLAELTRQHNNANILCLPARFVPLEKALEMVAAFLKTPFEGGRHARRVDKMTCL